MPYYRYMELENGMTVSDFTVFGMWAMKRSGRGAEGRPMRWRRTAAA
jgi:hypothetical protein